MNAGAQSGKEGHRHDAGFATRPLCRGEGEGTIADADAVDGHNEVICRSIAGLEHERLSLGAIK